MADNISETTVSESVGGVDGVPGDSGQEMPGRRDRDRGLYGKFLVSRTDGRDQAGERHDGCEYFVLDVTHDPFAKAALAAYADACVIDFPYLARDIRRLVSGEVLL